MVNFGIIDAKQGQQSILITKIMSDDKKDFKEVKVKVAGGNKDHVDTIDRTMLYSGVNIFGSLTQLYLNNREQLSQGTQSQNNQTAVSAGGLAGASVNSMMQIGNDVLAIFKKLQKKDSITKIKAFQELNNYINLVETDSEELPNLLTFFLFHMCRLLLNEQDKLVREAAHESFGVFIKKAKRKLGPHIKKIFPIWYCTFFDSSPEVARLAKLNFEAAFPPEKQPEVFKLAFKMFLNFADEQLQQSVEVGEDKKTQEEIFDRLTSCVLQALANSFQFIKSWSAEDQYMYKKKFVQILQLDSVEQKQTQKGGKSHKTVWSFLQSNYSGSVRSACLQIVAAFINEMPSDDVKQHIPIIGPNVFALVGESNTILQTTLWREALFTLSKSFPEAWTTLSIKKDFLPKLYKCLKEAGFGASSSLYENFVKYLSVCPLYKLTNFQEQEDKLNKASFKDRCNMIREVMIALYSGLQNDEAVVFHGDLVNSYCESLTFILLKRVQQIENQQDLEFVFKQLEKVIQQPIQDFIERYQKMSSKFQNIRNLRSTTSARFAKVLVDLSERNYDLNQFKTVCVTIQNALIPKLRNSMRFLSQILAQMNSMTPKYQKIVLETIVVSTFNKQTDFITKNIDSLSKTNIVETVEMSVAHKRLSYTLLKKKIDLSAQAAKQLYVGEVLQAIIKKKNLVKKMLNTELKELFEQLELSINEISILYLANTNFGPELDQQQEFCKVLTAAGLLEETVEDSISQLQVMIFSPDYPKVDLKEYFKILKTSDTLHELIVGSISIRMLSETGVVLYKDLLQTVIDDSVNNSQRSVLLNDDIDLIRTQISQNISDVADLNLIIAYFYSARSLCIQKDSLNVELREALLDKLLSLRDDSYQLRVNEKHFSVLWNVFENSVAQNPQYQEYVTIRLTTATSQLIQSSKQSDVASMNYLVKIISQFVQTVDQKVIALSKILLHKENFLNLHRSCLPLKMFKDLFLQGGIGFDIQELFSKKTKDDQYEYVWLTATLLSIQNLTSLSSLMELKRQLMIFIETEVVPAIINIALQPQNINFVMQTFKYLGEQNDLNSIEFLAQTLVDPGELYSIDQKPVIKTDEFKQIYQENVLSIAQSIIESNFANQTSSESLDMLIILLTKIGYYILDEPSVTKLFKQVQDNLKNISLTNLPYCSKQLQIYMSLERWLSKDDQTKFQISILNDLLKMDNLDMKQVAIDLCNVLLERQQIIKIKPLINADDLHLTIIELLENANELACLNTIKLCKVIRKTLDWSSNSSTIINILVQTTADRAFYFDQTLKNLSKGTVFIKPFEVEMLQELAETLLVLPQVLNELFIETSLEDSLYYLVGCNFQALKKSAFLILKFIYENFIPSVQFKTDIEDDIKRLMQQKQVEESKEQTNVRSTAFKNISQNLLKLIDEAPSQIDNQEDTNEQLITTKDELEQLVYGENEDGQMNSKIFGYLLAWNAMLLKIEFGRMKAQLQAEQGNNRANDYMQVLSALTEFLETDSSIYQMLLVSIVPYLPKIKKSGQEMFKNEISKFSPEYCNPKDSEQTKTFCLVTLINFMKSFPSLGRKFYQECDKQMLEIMLPYIKMVVSPAILENEIKKIELSQLELGANSDLTFVLFKSTKEVVATYNKTAEISCKLLLKIPADYPLKSVQVDIGEQLKLKQTQIRRWTLSIRNLLQSRNGDIITAILLWKTNIDKEMEGVEECYICYSVLHQSDKSLPSMQCKNCNNKFHVSCIRKWFNTSNKSNCPLCQTFFFQ